MEKKRDTRITVDLLEYKQAWLDYCAANGTTPSAAFREIVARLTTRQGANTGARLLASDKPEKATVRKKIGLTPSEAERIEAIAAEFGFSSTKWIVALIRSKLTGTPQFGQQELELLGRSNLHLLSIGRNLNQLAKALNTSPEERHLYRVELIERLQASIKEHTRKVAAAMLENIERWRIK